jgi:hypothetical protein
MRRPNELLVTVLITFFALPAHLIGLLVPSIYRDLPVVIPQNLGTDLTILVLGLPLLVGSTVWMRRGSFGARVLWLGALGFLTYAYGMYAMAVAWNPLFLAYVILFGLSLFGLGLGLVETDAARLRLCFAGRAPVKPVAWFLISVAILVGAMWLGEEVGSSLRGTIPPSVVQFGTPTNIVHVFDLAVVLPAMVIAGWMLLRDRPWGYVWSGVLLVKAASIALWIMAMTWFSSRRDFPTPLIPTILFGLLAVASLWLTGRYLSRVDSTRAGDWIPPSSRTRDRLTIAPHAQSGTVSTAQGAE